MSDAKPRTVWTASPLRFFHFFPLQLCLFSFLPPPRTFQQIYFTSKQSSFSLSLSLHISENPLAIFLPFSTIQSQVAHPSATAQPHISPRFHPASFHLPSSPSTGNEKKINQRGKNKQQAEHGGGQFIRHIHLIVCAVNYLDFGYWCLTMGKS